MKRKCKLCGTPERTNGIITNLSPYSSICIRCFNKMLDRTREKPHSPRAGRGKKK